MKRIYLLLILCILLVLPNVFSDSFTSMFNISLTNYDAQASSYGGIINVTQNLTILNITKIAENTATQLRIFDRTYMNMYNYSFGGLNSVYPNIILTAGFYYIETGNFGGGNAVRRYTNAASMYTPIKDNLIYWVNGSLAGSSNIDYWFNIVSIGYSNTSIGSLFIPTYSGLFSGVTNNTKNIILNISCTSGNISIWFDKNVTPSVKRITNQITPYYFNFSAYVDTNAKYYLQSSCNNGANNYTSVFTWTYDDISPLITLNPSTSFNTLNTSYLYIKNITINITGIDNIDLYGFEFLIYNSSGTIFYNKTNLSLTGRTTYTWSNFSIINWAAGIYYWNSTWADTHTNNNEFKDEDYLISRDSNKEITFETWQNNKINIKTQDETEWKIITLRDRKTFEVIWKKDWMGKISKKKIIEVECDKDLQQMKSGYNAHFNCVDWSKKIGNWIDFENNLNEIPKITEKKRLLGFGNKYYELEFNNNEDSMSFYSMGGLNFNTISGSFYIGNLTTTNAYIFPNTYALITDILTFYCRGIEGANQSITYYAEIYNNNQIQPINNFNLLIGNRSTINYFDDGGMITRNKYYTYAPSFYSNTSILYDLNGVNNTLYIPTSCNSKTIQIKTTYNVITTAIYCYSHANDSYLTIISKEWADIVQYQGIYLNNNTEYKPSDLNNSIYSNYFSEGSIINYTCISRINNVYSNNSASSNKVNITSVYVDNCTRYSNQIVNFSVKDILTLANISPSNIDYDLTFNAETFSNNVKGKFTDKTSFSFCTNINSSRPLNFTLYGNMFLELDSYSDKYYTIDAVSPLNASNVNFSSYNIYMVGLLNSTSVIFNWLTKSYQPIDGTLLIYKCDGSGGRVLYESVPLVDGNGVANLELLSALYSYEVIYNGVLYTNPNGYTQCHMEATTPLTYYVDTNDNILPIAGLIGLSCNVYKPSNTSVSLNWTLNEYSDVNILGCIYAYRNTIKGDVLVYTNCSNSSPLTRTIPSNAWTYRVIGKVFQNGYSKQCEGEEIFMLTSENGGIFGGFALFGIILLFLGMTMIYAGEHSKSLLSGSAAIIAAWILGIFAFGVDSGGWLIISSICCFMLIGAIILRYTKRG